jgi:hypothetical protein
MRQRRSSEVIVLARRSYRLIWVIQVCCNRSRLQMARRVHSRQRSSSVVLGAKRTLTETDLQNRICEGTLSSLEVSPPPARRAARTGCVRFLFSSYSVLLFVARREPRRRYVEPRFLCSPVACGASIGAGLYPASCFFSYLQGNTGKAACPQTAMFIACDACATALRRLCARRAR